MILRLLVGIVFFVLQGFQTVAAEEQALFQEGKPGALPKLVSMPSFASLADAFGSSVVNISVEVAKEENPEEIPLIPGIPFQFKRENPTGSMGSGFIVAPDGYIVTNNHVIERAGKIIVRLLDDKNEYDAKIIGRDTKTDVALLKIDAHKELKPVFLGDSESINVGDWVVAIGNQFQLGQTVTAGIVSAKSRRVPLSGPYDDFIQTDASINPGSSGGPLFNTSGQVVGINTAIFTPGKQALGGTGFNIGIGFATPINLVKRVIQQLRNAGKVTRGWLGVLIQPVNTDVAAILDLPAAAGALVGHVMPGSPAAKAKFLPGDIIVSFAGKAVKENDALPLMVADTPVGKAVPVEVIRAGKRETLQVTIEQLKDESAVKPKLPDVAKLTFNRIGLASTDLTQEIMDLLEVKAKTGYFVAAVRPGSTAERAGFVSGDLILSVRLKEGAETPIKDPIDLDTILAERKEGDALMLFVKRRDEKFSAVSTLYVTLKIE